MRVPPPENPQRIAALAPTFDGPASVTGANEPLTAWLSRNTDHAISAPVVIAQGLVVVPPAASDAYVEERCVAGQRLEYWRFVGGIARAGTPLDELLVAWAAARLANEP